MKLRYIAFTDRGKALGDRLASALGGEASMVNRPMSLDEWVGAHFNRGNGLVFIGAVGIAVRGIAGYVAHKSSDPAVVVIDEAGRFVIPILSGHLGGANMLANRISEVSGAVPVITTATDINGVFPIDDWARSQNCAIPDTSKIKHAAKRALSGDTVRIYSRWEISGEPPKGVRTVRSGDFDAVLDIYRHNTDALCIVPRICVLGIGCKRGTPCDKIDSAVKQALGNADIYSEAITALATIDLKSDEQGIIDYCLRSGLPMHTYSAVELSKASGAFESSAFVESVTGVDNVCERAAVVCSGGELILRKQAYDGVTVAVAEKPYNPSWRCENG